VIFIHSQKKFLPLPVRMNLILYVSLFVSASASAHKAVSFKESPKEAREVLSTPSSGLHVQLVSTLVDMGLEKVSEDLVESLYISLVELQKDTDSINTDEQIVRVINTSLFEDQSELSFGELLELIEDNVSTLSNETRLKFQEAVHKRYENLPLNDQGLITRLYNGISARLGFST
jgi:hypothetical protein